MAVQIKPFEMSSGLMGSKAGRVGMGFATGGLAGGAIALADNPNASGLFTIAKKLSAASGAVPGAEGADAAENMATDAVDSYQQPEVGDSMKENGAMGRRMSLGADTSTDDHEKMFDDGADALHQIDMPSDLKHQIATSLFAAKHYGMKGLQPPDHIWSLGVGQGQGE